MYFMFFGIFAAVIGLSVFTIASYAGRRMTTVESSKRLKVLRTVFLVVEALLTAGMFACVFFFRLIEAEWLRGVVRFVSAIHFVFLVYSGVLFLLRAIICGALRLCRRAECRFVKAVKGRCFKLVLAGVTIITGIAGFVSMGAICEKTYEVTVAKESVNDSVTLAVCSDLHVGIGTTPAGLDKMIEVINATDADAVLFVGDLIDDDTPDDYLELIAEKFPEIQSRYGVYFAYGNHDNNGDEKGLRYYLEKGGVKVLEDELVTIAGDVQLLGRQDLRRNPAKLDQLPIDFSKPLIIMNHQPNGLAELAASGADVTVSGHTHGYQFPFVGMLVEPFNDSVYGVKMFGDMYSVTTCGVGGWGFHFKLPSRSEVVKLTVKFE